MIKTELLNEGKFIRHYSDLGYMVLQNETGIEYSEAIDIIPCQYTYSESGRLIPTPEGVVGDGISGDEFLRMVQEVL